MSATAAALVALHASDSAATLRTPALDALSSRHADFRGEAAPRDVRRIADWAVDSRDHEGLPFIVIDKKAARVYVFSSAGRLLDSAPALLGRAVGDDFAPGVVDMDMFDTSAWQRVTPAGRFRSFQYRKAPGNWILWVDYDSAIALHKVLLDNSAEDRQARISAADPDQRRITYGCINVPIQFYERVVFPTFRRSEGIVYVLPETRALETVFDVYDVPVSGALATPVALTALRKERVALAPARALRDPSSGQQRPFDRPTTGGMKLLPQTRRLDGAMEEPQPDS